MSPQCRWLHDMEQPSGLGRSVWAGVTWQFGLLSPYRIPLEGKIQLFYYYYYIIIIKFIIYPANTLSSARAAHRRTCCCAFW